MSWWRLARADLARTPRRSFFTGLSLVAAFILFGLLQPLRVMFKEGIQLSGDSRLIVAPRHSVADMLPVNHAIRIAQLDDIERVAHMTWFGGIYQDVQNFFPQYAVTPEYFLAINAEIQLADEAARAFVENRRSAIVGRATAERFGWQMGDKISLIPSIWHNIEGVAWDFELAGIFTSSNDAVLGNDGFFFGYPYFDEYRAFGKGSVGTFLLEVNPQADLAEVAARIDATFANSSEETRTQSSAEYVLSFARQVGDVGAMATVILIAVLFTLLMLTGYSMSRSTYERTAEIAVMRVLGFKPYSLAVLLISEFVVFSIIAAVVGLACAYAIGVQLEQIIPQVRQIGGISVSFQTVLHGLLLALFVGLSVALLPVTKAVLRPVVPALRVEA